MNLKISFLASIHSKLKNITSLCASNAKKCSMLCQIPRAITLINVSQIMPTLRHEDDLEPDLY